MMLIPSWTILSCERCHVVVEILWQKRGLMIFTSRVVEAIVSRYASGVLELYATSLSLVENLQGLVLGYAEARTV